jgi:CubicO group peptidase (beta-lactamase class C family)
MKKTFFVFTSLFLYFSILLQGQDTITLETGQLIKRNLIAGEKHIYTLDLDANQFVAGKIDQKGVSVIIILNNPLGKQIGRFNMIAMQEGFYMEATDSGQYSIEVSPLYGSGEYSLEITNAEPLGNTPEIQINQILNALYFTDGPGGAVAVVHKGKIIYTTAYGMANLTHMNPFTTETLSNIGSVSKQFTGFAIALLEKEGKLSFDDDIRMYIPECPDFGQPVTIRHLLNQTSGYREIKRTFGMKGIRGDWTKEELIQQIQNQKESQNSPGSEFSYTNTSYILLAELVERVSGVSFREWMKANIFDSLGMNNTSVNSPIYATIQRVVPNSAQGYYKMRGEYGHVIDEQALYGASSIYSSVIDLSKWLQNFASAEIGGEEIISNMTTKGILTNGDTIDYAFGLFVDKQNGLLHYYHDGFDGFHWTELSYYPEIEAGIIILNNCRIFPTVSSKIFEAFFGEFTKTEKVVAVQDSKKSKYHEVDPSLLDAYSGRYSAKEDDRIIVTFVRNDKILSTHVISSRLLPSNFNLTPVNDTLFINNNIDVSATFQLNDSRQVDQVFFKYSEDFTLNRLVLFDPSAQDLLAFAGIYYSPELISVYTITIEEDHLTLTIPNGLARNLEPKYPDTFTGENYGEYRFERNKDGIISGFVVQNVHFEKLK